MDLKEFVEDRLRAFIPPTPTENSRPGRLFGVQRWGWAIPINTSPHIAGELGWAWDFTDEREEQHQRAFAQGNPVQERILDSRTFGIGFPLPQYGLNIGASFRELFEVSITITAMRIESFRLGTSAPDLYERLLSLRRGNRHYWRFINNSLFVTESIYVSECAIHFDGSGERSAKAEIETAGASFGGSLNATWKTESDVLLKGTPPAPLAIRGMRV